MRVVSHDGRKWRFDQANNRPSSSAVGQDFIADGWLLKFEHAPACQVEFPLSFSSFVQ
jgi:hypothetical protein